MIDERTPKRKSFDIEGHVHELTFTCYRRQRFLAGDEEKREFLDCLRLARNRHGFLVWAYVLMPEHVHLLIAPRGCPVRVILRSVKQPVSQRIIAKLKKEEGWPGQADALTKGWPGQADDRAVCPGGVLSLKNMTSGATRGNSPYSFWQAGGGYDRNLYESKTIWKSVRYIHMNPVRRGLALRPEDWPWSSCRNYLGVSPVELEVDICDARTY